VANPHEYALVYGSPVPGYQAPPETIGPATRAAAVLGKIIGDAHRDGALAEAGWWPPVPGSFAPDAARLAGSVLPGVPADIAARALAAWAGLFGLVSFELFGQFENVVTERDEYFRYAVACLGRFVGFPT
jgi:hypothetical protein